MMLEIGLTILVLLLLIGHCALTEWEINRELRCGRSRKEERLIVSKNNIARLERELGIGGE